VAASTTTLRVGTSVILLPLHHPVRLAEDVVTLDIISKGRVTVGVGLGYQPADFQAFGITMSDRVELFEEKIEILRNCWSGQEFSYEGKHHSIKNLRVRPDTVQSPHPPLWIGGGAPVSARRAGTLGDAFVSTPSTTLQNTCRLIDQYRRSADAAGKKPEVVIMRDAWVAGSRKEAEEVYGPEVLAAYRYYWRNGLSEFKSIKDESELTLDRIAKDRLILGDPQECLTEFQRWQEATGAETCLLRLRHAHSGGPSHGQIMKTIDLIGDRIIPYCD
jgi:probable F420-dependent oxidoreductase